MKKATMTSKGQVTIPSEIRRQAHLSKGTRLIFNLEKDGSINLRPITKHISELKGIIKSNRKTPVSLKEMKQAIHKGIEEKLK